MLEREIADLHRREATLIFTSGWAKETDRGALKSVRRFFARGGSAAMTTMTHDGYVAAIELDEEAGLIHHSVVNTPDVLAF